MAQPHNKKLGEYPMTTRGREQGPEKRYRRLRFPAFTAAKWTAVNPLLQRGELGVETDTRKIKVGDGITYWNDLEYAKAYSDWGNIAGDITEQTDLVDFVNAAVAAEANIRSQADQQLQTNINSVATDLSTHEQDTGNPHDVTKAQVGLGNVDNTSDIDKPVSNAQATAINNAVSEHNTSDTAHSNLFSQYRTSESQDNIDSNLQSQITNNDTDITNLQNTKADKATTLAGYGITDAYTKTEVDAKVSSVYRFRGSVATYANLPTTGQVVGDVWNVEDTGANYAWSGSEWDKLSETVDLTPYLTKADAANTYATIATVNGKQDTLTTDQLAAANSGITADHVASYDAYAGEISAAQTEADKANAAVMLKVNIDQGTANAGKLLGVGDDGNVAPVPAPNSAIWGQIQGTLSEQTDLSDALNKRITSPCSENFDGKITVKSLTIQESTNNIQDGDDWPDGVEGDTIITSDDTQNPDWYLNFVNGLPANSGRQQLNIPVGYTTYTMPDDGYIMGTLGAGDNATNNSLVITNTSNGISQTYAISNRDQQIDTRCGVCFPAIKGSVISISRQANITADLSFIPVAKAINPHPGQARWPVKILDNQSDGLYTNGSVIVYNDGWMEFHWQKYDVSQDGALLTPPIKFKDKGSLEWQPATSVVGLLRYNGTVNACVAGSAVSPDGSKIWVATRPFPNITEHSSVSGYTCGYGDPDVLHTMYPDLF